jgi:type IV secretory pathway VirB3-like protein
LKVKIAEKSFKKTFVALLLFLVCYVTVKKQSKEFKSIAEEIKMKIHPEEVILIEEEKIQEIEEPKE